MKPEVRATMLQARAAVDLAALYYSIYKKTDSQGCLRKSREKIEESRILIALAQFEHATT